MLGSTDEDVHCQRVGSEPKRKRVISKGSHEAERREHIELLAAVGSAPSIALEETSVAQLLSEVFIPRRGSANLISYGTRRATPGQQTVGYGPEGHP